MFSLTLLVCTLGVSEITTPDCGIYLGPVLYETREACEADLVNGAMPFFLAQGQEIHDFQCYNWEDLEPTGDPT